MQKLRDCNGGAAATEESLMYIEPINRQDMSAKALREFILRGSQRPALASQSREKA